MAIRVLEEPVCCPPGPGVMSWAELSRLKMAPSMGMMLETTSRRLFRNQGLAHYGSPDKDPEVRLRTLTDASRLSIPFTTGLLVGIGETPGRAGRDACTRSGGCTRSPATFREVIVQNFRAKGITRRWRRCPDAGFDDSGDGGGGTVVLGPKMQIQAPPNLVSRANVWR